MEEDSIYNANVGMYLAKQVFNLDRNVKGLVMDNFCNSSPTLRWSEPTDVGFTGFP